jgi:hypothetical protein
MAAVAGESCFFRVDSTCSGSLNPAGSTVEAGTCARSFITDHHLAIGGTAGCDPLFLAIVSPSDASLRETFHGPARLPDVGRPWGSTKSHSLGVWELQQASRRSFYNTMLHLQVDVNRNLPRGRNELPKLAAGSCCYFESE